ASAEDLPAYRLQSPVREQLAGYAPAMAAWPWVEPPAHEVVPPVVVPEPNKEPALMTLSPDLVVLSHLRWSFVWQRPQHLVTRLTRSRAAGGARAWFVEEPHATRDVDRPRLRTEE